MTRTNKSDRPSKPFVPSAWQRDPASLKTDRVQMWLASGSMAGLVTLAQAREMIAEGCAFVVTDQAISQF